MLKIDKSKEHNFPKSKEEWVLFVNKSFSSALEQRRSLEIQWARNISYYLGFQHLAYDPALNLIEMDYSRNEEYIINRLAAYVDQRIAKYTRSAPIISVIPDKKDEKTIRGAKLSSAALKYLWKILKKDDLLDSAVLYMVLTGTAFKKTIWDSNGGIPLKSETDSEGAINYNPETGGIRHSLEYTGEIGSLFKTPFEMVSSGNSFDIQKNFWVGERTLMHLDEINQMYDEFDMNRFAKKSYDERTVYERFLTKLGSPIGNGEYAYSLDNRIKSSIKEIEYGLIKEMWMKPNSVYSNGLLITVCGDQLLQFEENPYEHRLYPYTKITEHKRPFCFYGESTLSRIVPIQRHYNETRTQIAKNRRIMANCKWWVPAGSGLAEDALTDEEGEIIETNASFGPPQQLGVVPLPNYVIEDQNQDIVDIREVSGERPIDQAPFAGLTAGVAIETMAELADIGLGPSMRSIERALEEEGRIELLLMNEMYTDERKIIIFDEYSAEIDATIFSNIDLMNQTEVTIQIQSSLGETRAAVRQQLLDLWDRRIIVDPKVFLKSYRAGNIDIALAKDDPIRAVLIEQIESIKNGQMPAVFPFDSHLEHIKSLNEFINTPEYRRMPPDRQNLAIQTLQAHIQFVQQAQSQMQQQQQVNPAAVNTPFGSQRPEGMSAPTA